MTESGNIRSSFDENSACNGKLEDVFSSSISSSMTGNDQSLETTMVVKDPISPIESCNFESSLLSIDTEEQMNIHSIESVAHARNEICNFNLMESNPVINYSAETHDSSETDVETQIQFTENTKNIDSIALTLGQILDDSNWNCD